MPYLASRPHALDSIPKVTTDEFITNPRPSLRGEKSCVCGQSERAIWSQARAAISSLWTVEINPPARLDEINRQIAETKSQFFLGEKQVCEEDQKARLFSSRNFFQINFALRRPAESCSTNLLETMPRSKILLFADSPVAPFFLLPKGMDHIKLPSIKKVRAGRQPTHLRIRIQHLQRMRGTNLRIFSANDPRDKPLHAVAVRVRANVMYLSLSRRWRTAVVANLRLACNSPWQYCQTLVKAIGYLRRKMIHHFFQACFLKRLGLEHQVRFLGAQAHEMVPSTLQRATVFGLRCVIAADGDRNSIPTVLLEAMASGVPVVSTMVSGVPELFESGTNGLLVDSYNPLLFADAVGNLLTNPGSRDRLGRAARDTVESRIQLSAIALNCWRSFARAKMQIKDLRKKRHPKIRCHMKARRKLFLQWSPELLDSSRRLPMIAFGIVAQVV